MTDNEVDTVFAALADTLIPEAEGMPRASAAADLVVGLKTVLNARPDLRADIMRGLRHIHEKGLDKKSLDALASADLEAWTALTLTVATAYYNSPKIQALTRYDGPQRRRYDADATPEYVTNGMLDVVITRGPIWRKV